MRVWKSFGIDPDSTDRTPALDAVEKEASNHDNRLFFFLSKDDSLTRVLDLGRLADLLDEDSLSYHYKNVDAIFKRVFGDA
jgi:adenylosuccinate lyase